MVESAYMITAAPLDEDLKRMISNIEDSMRVKALQHSHGYEHHSPPPHTHNHTQLQQKQWQAIPLPTQPTYTTFLEGRGLLEGGQLCCPPSPSCQWPCPLAVTG